MDFFLVYVYKVLCGQPEPNSKEMQAMTDERVSACVKFAKKSSSYLLVLHDCTNVQQINSVPLFSHCCSSGKRLDDGVQLIMDETHVCLDRDVAKKWYHYYRLRHFPRFVCGLVLDWVKIQPWYFDNKVFDIYRLLNSHWPETYKKMYRESFQIVMT